MMITNRTRKELGSVGEAAAAAYLQAKGLKLVARNWRCRAGELDLVFIQGNELVLVEVKSRKRSKSARTELFAAIDERKKKKLRQLAQLFAARAIQEKKLNRCPRFRIDVVGVILDPRGAVVELEHIVGAV